MMIRCIDNDDSDSIRVGAYYKVITSTKDERGILYKTIDDYNEIVYLRDCIVEVVK